MCLLAISFQNVADAPVCVAANREERYDRPALPPAVHQGRPRVLCGTDREAGGTWLGVNQHGLLVAVTNRAKSSVPPAPRSRGRLCRELLECRSAAEAIERARSELATSRYAGANYLCVDAVRGAFVCAGEGLEVIDLDPGLHLVTNGDPDDPDDERQRLARRLFGAKPAGSARDFIASARRVCADPGIVVREADRGTVSSDLVALADSGTGALYLHASGSPDERPYEDFSQLFRALRSGLRPNPRSGTAAPE